MTKINGFPERAYTGETDGTGITHAAWWGANLNRDSFLFSACGLVLSDGIHYQVPDEQLVTCLPCVVKVLAS